MPDVPLVSLDDIVLFPGQTLPLTVTRPAVIRALKALLEDSSARRLLLVASPAAIESERGLRVGTTGGEAAPQMCLARPACVQNSRRLCAHSPPPVMLCCSPALPPSLTPLPLSPPSPPSVPVTVPPSAPPCNVWQCAYVEIRSFRDAGSALHLVVLGRQRVALKGAPVFLPSGIFACTVHVLPGAFGARGQAEMPRLACIHTGARIAPTPAGIYTHLLSNTD